MKDDIPVLIARLEDERYAAMLSGDAPALDRLLDPQLRYVHSSGVADGKESYLRGLASGQAVYRSIERSEQSIVPLADTALVFNRLAIDILVAGAPRIIHAAALAVWRRTEDGWRLIAVQSAALPVQAGP